MGRQVGKYELVEQLGEGGMGEVWWARHQLLNRPAAIKVIKPDILGTRRGDKAKLLLRRFEREARAMSALTSPHTVQVYDFGLTEDGSFFYAMEMMDGCNLQTLVERNGPIEAHRAVYMLTQVCESLAEAHHSGLIHRDIKPANIFLCQVGLRCDYVKVLDFGLVKLPPEVEEADSHLTNDEVAQGTPAFIPPEIVDGSSSFTAQSDIYALGCVAYWLLSGQLVFEASSPLEVVMAHVTKEPVPLSKRCEVAIPRPLEDLVMQCLAKKPCDRPASVRAMRQLLDQLPLEQTWTEQMAETWWSTHQPQKWTRTEVAAGLRTRLSPMVELVEPDKPSIIVMPFENRSSDPDQEYFADGIIEDLILELAKIPGLFVIARNTSFRYKGPGVDVKKVCSEVGVRYALTGSVRRSGKRVRVTAQLVDTVAEKQLWTDRFDRELHDIFEVQDEVTREIVSALRLELGPRDKPRTMDSEELQRYELNLRLRELDYRGTEVANRLARDMAQKALEADPNNAAALARLGSLVSVAALNRWDADVGDLQRGLEMAQRAYELDPQNTFVTHALTITNLFASNLDEAVAAADRTLAMDPNSAMALIARGVARMYMGFHEEAIDAYRRATRLDPAHPGIVFHHLAQAMFMTGRYEEAIDACIQRMLRDPETDITRVLLAASYAAVGRHEEARASWRDALAINPDFSLQYKLETLPYRDKSHYQKIIDALASAGITQ